MSIQATPAGLITQAEGIEANAANMEQAGFINASERARAIAARLRDQADTLPVDMLIARATSLAELERGLSALETGSSLDAWSSQERQVEPAPTPAQQIAAAKPTYTKSALPPNLATKLDMVPREWSRVEFGVSVSCVALIRRGLVEKRRQHGKTEYRRIDPEAGG